MSQKLTFVTVIRTGIGRVVKVTCINGVRAWSIPHWYASSLLADAEQFASIIREHWAVENQLHWVLDVAFREDQLKISDPDRAAHFTLFNRACLNLIKKHQGKKDNMAAKRRRAAWSDKFITELLFG